MYKNEKSFQVPLILEIHSDQDSVYILDQQEDYVKPKHKKILIFTIRAIKVWIKDVIKKYFLGRTVFVRPKLTILFFPVLRFDLLHCDSIVLCLRGLNQIDFSKKMFVNGIKAPFIFLRKSGPDVWILTKKEPFEPWENVIAFEIGENKTSFEYLRELLWPQIWSISIYPAFKEDPRKKEKHVSRKSDSPMSNEKAIESKKLALQFLLNSLNSSDHSSFAGTFFPAYDLDNQTYRLPSWTWCSAVVIKALLEEYCITSEKSYLNLAVDVAQNLLKFQVKDGEEFGGFMVRWDYWVDSPMGVVPWLAPNDSAFIGSYALLPMYVETSNEVYLKSAIQIGDWIIRRGINQNGRIYVGFRLDTKTWEKNWLYVDAGYTLTIFCRLWEVTGDEKWRRYLRLIAEDFITLFHSPKGYFYARWESPTFLAKHIFTRGQAWAIDGMIAAYLGLDDHRYLEIALRCSNFLMRLQNRYGSWNYRYLRTHRFTGFCNKATPILAYHFLRLYNIIRDEKLKLAARLALDWCESNQYKGSDPKGLGGIHARNDEGCIVGTRGVDNILSYANAFYVMALNLWERSKSN